MNDMNEEWKLTIKKVENGYILIRPNERPLVCEEDEMDELGHHERMLWAVMEYFNFSGCKHDKERLRIVREQNE